MNSSENPLDRVIQETVHLQGGVDLVGDPRQSLALPAEPIIALFDVSDDGAALIESGATVERQVAIWVEGRFEADARRLLSHALPPRQGLWWALLSLMEAHRQKPYPAKVLTAILAVRDFILNPTDARRRACKDLAEAAGSTTPGGVIGYAAFLSGGSMAPADCPPVLPLPHLCGRLCGVSVYLASVHFNPAKYKDHLRHFIDIGLQVARDEIPVPGAAVATETAHVEKLEVEVERVVLQAEARRL